MLHGKSPFERPEPMAALVAVISDEPDPPEKGGQLVPVIEGLLRKNPDQRMDAIEASRMLDEIVRQETVDTQRTMAVEYPVEESPGTQTTMPEAPEEAPRPADAGARPDQLTSFDLPMGKPSARESANPAETAPDPDRVRSWRPGPGTQPAGRVTVPSGGPSPDPTPTSRRPPTTRPPGVPRSPPTATC
ncbi:hypothetical protein ACFQY7_31745 [Actinomadura luteofluorescens]|uniref:hypothetical protein n=1 Tax=Actinomadura luteofluorescens TaxID=46163 RepID=UPI00363ECF37